MNYEYTGFISRNIIRSIIEVMAIIWLLELQKINLLFDEHIYFKKTHRSIS